MSIQQQTLMLEILKEMREDIKDLRDEMATIKAQREMVVWAAGVLGAGVSLILQQFFFKGNG